MSELTTRSVLHKRITTFVDWIKPELSKREEIKERANKVREKIKNKAESDKYNLVVVSTPNAGSFTTKTGLRRHFRGDAEVEGLDVDLPFVIQDNQDGYALFNLLEVFHRIVDDCFPSDNVKIERTKSSIKIKFPDKVNLDIVPMLEGDNIDEQIIIRSTGEKIHTSVKKHVDFIKKRTNASNNEAGRVKYNECLRLFKWWRDTQANDSYWLGGDDSPASFLINLLTAKAFDELSVRKTYAETLSNWFGYLAHLVKNKEPILFSDYNNPTRDYYIWSVIDPVNPDNNIVKNWSSSKIDELAGWLENGRDNWNRIIGYDLEGEDTKSIEELIKIFGNSFKNHSE
ncbi:CBASS oligonucleotide cyclase [Winogradskyella sp.]|uniref:CBASS oligonucleotide cyclase n=1 Tax=Winogradskyella sp. TaxID=1883156 RepID=UPI003BA9F2B4